MEKSLRFKDKQFKQQQVPPTDRNANSPTTTTTTTTTTRETESNENIVSYDNYMKLNYFEGRRQAAAAENGKSSENFKELFCDFPVSYETTEVITALQFAQKNTPHVDPPPPTPPPISQLPKRDNRLQHLLDTNISVSAPASPSRGKVVLSRKERKELNKLHKLLDRADTASSSINLGNLEATELMSAHAESNTYRGRVSELRNCIAKINTKVLFGSLNRNSHKSLTTNSVEFINTEACPDLSPPQSSNFNNNDENYSEKLKNLPVRQRKTHTSHMENYCLFDPVDFINEKKLRHRSSVTQKETNLRDPLFSSRQNLEFLDEDVVPEIIYDNEEEAVASGSYEHHNYFVIDPEDFEQEPTTNIGLPDKHSNENFAKCKVEISLQDDIIQVSKSCENILQRETEVNLISKSISQETKSTAPTEMLLECSTSSSAASALTSSSTSAASSQTTTTTLQRTKKKLSFLSLSPFRSQSAKSEQVSENKVVVETNGEHKSVERAMSELVSCDHMLHLQQMLLNSNKENMRSRTVPIESNYVLFNPGPVPSRNVPYKVRKPRPLSTNSDADSGFLSPCSPDEMSSLKSNPAILVLQQCDSVQGYLEIYTDWANYYLERAKSKKRVIDLSADCRDGLLLADVIEAVTSFKVPDLVKKPKTQQHMYDNINSCLTILRAHAVGGLDNVTANDICSGRLKAVLALFFALSRYKQQAKQSTSSAANNSTAKCSSTTQTLKHEANSTQHATKSTPQLAGTTTRNSNANLIAANTTNEQCIQNGNEMVNRQIPSAYSKANGGTAIPLPATVMVQRRCPPDKVRPLPPTPNHTSSVPGLGKNGIEFTTSRPNSPPSNEHSAQENKTTNNNGLRPPTTNVGKTVGQSGIPPPSSVAAVPQQKHSMLDKLKLFNKEKHQQSATSTNRNQTQSKRTSSSSGFSSARSERSDSSLSLNDGHVSQIKPPTVSVTGNKAAKNNTKQSKLLLAQMKKDQMKANKDKSDKKERSPARSLNKEDATTPTSSSECKTSTLNRTKQTTTNRFNEKHSAPTTKSNININSHTIAPKTSQIIPPTKTLTSPTGNATLPKPIAAIKGTSKLPQPPSCAGPAATSTPESKARSNETLKRENSDISSTQSQSNISANINENLDQTQRSSPAHKNSSPAKKPTAAATQTEPSTASYYANAAAINNAQHEQQNLDQTNTHSSYNNLNAQEPTYINSGRLPPLKSALSPHLRKLDYNLSGHSGLLSPLQSPIRTLSQMTQSRPETPNSTVESSDNNSTNAGKYYTVPTKIVGSIIYEEEKPVSVLPMRPLLRGYNSHVTLPTRGTHGNTSHFVTDFCENDIGQGYCSDGDVLRVSNSRIVGRQPSSNGGASASASASSSARFLDIDNGYLSEGGGPTTRNGNSNGKHFLTAFRHRTQLPTTIEERIRNSRGSLDSIGTQPPSSAGSQASSDNSTTAAAALNMDATMNGHHQQQQQQMAHRLATRNGRDNWSKMPEPMNDHKSDRMDKSSSPSHSRRHVGSAGSPSKQSSASGRTKGVPPSFGYVKRTNGSATATAEQQNIVMMGAGRTAHISAVPRTAAGTRKVSGGTQTLPNDIKMATNTQHRSFSLTGPGASQLSQSIRERLSTGSHSLPKPGTDMHLYQHRLSNRTTKMLDGSLSDTQTYAEVRPEYSTYAMWLKHSNTAGSRLSEGESLENIQIGSPNMTRHGLKMLQQHQHRPAAVQQATATGNPSVDAAYVQSPRLNRSNSIRSTKSEKMYPNVLNRSGEAEIEPYYCLPVGSIAAAAHNGTISAQIAAAAAAAAAAAGVSHVNATGAAVSGGNGAAVAWSQPTSPSPVSRVFGGTLSPTTSAGVSNALSMMTGNHRLTYPKKNDEVHGSAASLLSGGSSLYGSAEERQANEIRRLKRELMDAREQVLSLSSQLSTNAHVVSAFEQSLSNMTSRLQHLTATAERKDGELTDMRQTIELLRKQSIQAGLTTAHMQSMGVQTQSQMDLGQHANANAAQMTKQLQSAEVNGTTTAGVMQRHHSSDSMCSLNSISSNCSTHDKIKKKKGWLRSSFTKAFSRNAKISKTNRHAAGGHYGSDSRMAGASPARSNGHHAIKEESINSNNSTAHSSVNGNHSVLNSSPAKTVTLIDNAKPIDAIETEDHPVVEDLKKQLREKDLVLTDIRLEALSSASQLESLKETVNKMRAEMLSLKQNNERLQKLVTSRSLAGSEISLGHAISPSGSVNESRRFSLADTTGRPPIELPKRLNEHIEEENIPPAPAPEPQQAMSPATHIDLTPPPPTLESLTNVSHLPLAEEMSDVTDGKKIAIACYLGQPESFRKYCEEMLETDTLYANSCILNENGEAEGNDMKSSFNVANLNEFVIAYTYISGKTTWQNLDYIVRKTFKDYVARIDPGTNLGLNTDSITSYHLGEAKRGPEMGFPELLPCGYIVGNVRNLYICLQGVGSLAFDSLIPRSIVHRYISLLTEHRRLILCGPSGTGKSYLARRLAEFLVARSVRGNPSEAIATFNVDHKSSKDLRQYLGHIAEQAAIANGASELPAIIILDNLHHASALGDIFSCLLSAGPAAKLPCIIGTMSQATCNTTNLQLHHNFRWVLTANHMEPVKGFLGRFLRRRLFQMELQTQKSQPELAAVLAWLPTVWQHINRFLEIHSSSDVTIGPRLFLTCPLDLKDSQIWFTDVWNYHLAPYLVEAVREGVQLYGRRGGPWNDPSIFIRNSYPWAYGADSVPPLRQIHAEDVGLEGVSGNNNDSQDPLLNMLMRLQEAANYSENQDPESDCASLDSNITPESSAGAE